MPFIFGLCIIGLVVAIFGSYIGDSELTKIGSMLLLFSSGGLLGSVASRK